LYSLVAGDQGDVWTGSHGYNPMRLFRVQDRKFAPGGPDHVITTYRDPEDVIWVSSKNLFQRWKAGVFTEVPSPDPAMELHRSPTRDPITVSSVTSDRTGTLWVAFGGCGEFQLKDRTWTFVPILKDHRDWAARYAYTDAVDRIWLVYGSVIAVADHGKARTFSAQDGLTVGPFNVIGGRGEQVWGGGESGIALLKDGRFYTLKLARGVELGLVTGIDSPPNEGLWLSAGAGIVHIPEREVQQVLRSPGYEVNPEIFDVESDLPEQLQRSDYTYNTGVIRANDGMLWFATRRGVARVNPGDIYRNPLPPPISIRSIVADGKSYSVFANSRLPALTKNLRIDYTALSLMIPQRVRFRYMLEGWEKEWQDAGPRRQAFYENLPPGKYTFRVIACNNDGVWNETAATLDFRVSPAWYQTIWFRFFYVLAFALFLWALHQLRLRQLARQFNMRLEERVGERTRIARELHDTLLQNLHGLMFQYQAARNMVHKRPDEAIQTLDSAIIETEETIAESQDAIRDLRSEPTAQNDLEQLLTAMANELANSQAANQNVPSVRIIVEGERRTLLPFIQDEVYRIAREVLRNAFQHANAHRVEAEIRYDKHAFRLRVRDDGKGLEPEVLKRGRRAGHWGLPGVRERAQCIGAKLDLWSEAGAGTELQLTVPGALAYEPSRDRSGFRLFRRMKL
jgi:signal transduction histidine kinase